MGYNTSYKWINPTYPIYNLTGVISYNPLTKWDEPPSTPMFFHWQWTCMTCFNGNYTKLMKRLMKHHPLTYETWILPGKSWEFARGKLGISPGTDGEESLGNMKI